MTATQRQSEEATPAAPAFVSGLDAIAAWLSTPTVVMIGDVRMLLPAGSPRLTNKTLGLLGRAWIAQSESRLGAVEVNVEKIEAAVWPKDFDPRARWPAPRDIKITTPDQHRATELRKVSAMAPTLDVDARLRTDEVGKLDKAIDKLDRATNKGNRQAAADEIKSIRAKPRQRVESKWRAAALEETVTLAAARGEEIDIKPARGAACIRTRDGLYGLTRPVQHLSPDQYIVGLDYRAGYEVRGADLKASTIGDSSGGAHDNGHFVAARFERAKLAEFTARVDRAVVLDCAGHPTALQMLRWVAGQGHSLSAYGEGRALARNRDALIAALDVAIGVAKAMREEARKRREEALKRELLAQRQTARSA